MLTNCFPPGINVGRDKPGNLVLACKALLLINVKEAGNLSRYSNYGHAIEIAFELCKTEHEKVNLLALLLFLHWRRKFYFSYHLENSFQKLLMIMVFQTKVEMELQEVMSAHPVLKAVRRHRNSVSAPLDYTVQLPNVCEGWYSKQTGKSHINLNKVQLNRNEELHNYEINCFSILPTETFSAWSEFPNVHSNFNDSSNGFYTSQIIEEQYENHHTLLLIQNCQIYCSQQAVSMQIPFLQGNQALGFFFFFFNIIKRSMQCL